MSTYIYICISVCVLIHVHVLVTVSASVSTSSGSICTLSLIVTSPRWIKKVLTHLTCAHCLETGGRLRSLLVLELLATCCYNFDSISPPHSMHGNAFRRKMK
jgi:hypothetical protein